MVPPVGIEAPVENTACSKQPVSRVSVGVKGHLVPLLVPVRLRLDARLDARHGLVIYMKKGKFPVAGVWIEGNVV